MKLRECVKDDYAWIGGDEAFPAPQAVEDFYSSLEGEQLEIFQRVCKNLPCAKEYMRKHFEKYGWFQEMFDEASIFTPAELPRPVPYFPEPWCCYENSFNYAEKHGLLYVEGIGINPTGPQIHAWCSTDGTDVIDYTWPYQHVNKYFGSIYDRKWMIEKFGRPGGILDQLYREATEGLTKSAAK